jgi:hypothetical protein
MLKIQKLKRPTRMSGDLLLPGKTFKKRGLTITNSGGVKNVYVDEWKRPVTKKKRKKKK